MENFIMGPEIEEKYDGLFIEGFIEREDGKDFSISEFIELLESEGFTFGGGFKKDFES